MRTQVVRTAPQTVIIGQYITAKGLKLLDQPKLKKAEIQAIKEKYTKNRRAVNIDSKPLTATFINSNGKLRNKQRHIKHVI